jgi:hypothetical protein
MRRHVPAAALAFLLLALGPAGAMLPSVPDATSFAIIGDSGTGEGPEYEIAKRLSDYHGRLPFTFVLMLGDNLYGSERPQDFDRKFAIPFKPLLDAGVKFYATLGNHDDPNQRFYKPFNMNGERYYTFSKGPIEFFVLDSNYMEPKQVAWLEKQLSSSRARWKIAYCHHPLYSSGSTHGSETDLRALVEPLFVKYGVNLVFAGHEHFYERIKPQQGIAYFIEGGAAKLRSGDIQQTELEAAGFDRDRSFMVAEVTGDTFQFETISRTGQIVDSGTVVKPSRQP